MCAINGICWDDVALVSKMNKATLHRGPDGSKVQRLGGAAFGHNRLAVIDLDQRSSPVNADSRRAFYHYIQR